jgi:hypothetical protein
VSTAELPTAEGVAAAVPLGVVDDAPAAGLSLVRPVDDDSPAEAMSESSDGGVRSLGVDVGVLGADDDDRSGPVAGAGAGAGGATTGIGGGIGGIAGSGMAGVAGMDTGGVTAVIDGIGFAAATCSLVRVACWSSASEWNWFTRPRGRKISTMSHRRLE